MYHIEAVILDYIKNFNFTIKSWPCANLTSLIVSLQARNGLDIAGTDILRCILAQR